VLGEDLLPAGDGGWATWEPLRCSGLASQSEGLVGEVTGEEPGRGEWRRV